MNIFNFYLTGGGGGGGGKGGKDLGYHPPLIPL